MIIRTATIDDLEQIHQIEKTCFPLSEAATKEQLKERLYYYGNHFCLLFENNQLISFIDGFVTNEKDLTDQMYEQASMHDELGHWQMIFGVNTSPSNQHKGYASEVMNAFLSDAKKQGRKGVVLTCKKKLISFYEKFGFVNEGITDQSVHGNVQWYQMRLTF